MRRYPIVPATSGEAAGPSAGYQAAAYARSRDDIEASNSALPLRSALISAAVLLALQPLRVSAAFGTLVARRGFGLHRRLADQIEQPLARVGAVARLVAVACATMTMTPSLVSRLPASRISRTATSFGSDGEWRTSKRNCTADDTLLTFCPPGPGGAHEALRQFGFVDGDGVGDADHDAVKSAHSRASGNPEQLHSWRMAWVPACAGTNGGG